MTRYARHIAKSTTPQTERVDSRQVRNDGGGFSYAADKWTNLRRWLILGAEGGSYNVGERQLVKRNVAAIDACLAEDGVRTVDTIVDVSKNGCAPKNDPAILALALASAASDDDTRRAACAAIPAVCRTSTHLFNFVGTIKEGEIRGFGRGLRQGIMSFYAHRDEDSLAYQICKYAQRNGWSHRDILRLCGGAKTDWDWAPGHEAAMRYAVCGPQWSKRVVQRGDTSTTYKAIRKNTIPEIILGVEAAKAAKSEDEIVGLINEHGLTHEMIPSEFKGSAAVWGALLTKMPPTAMIRNLGRMSANGLLTPMSDAARLVAKRLRDAEYLRRGRVHPLAVLMALNTYGNGRGVRGSLTWTPVQTITDALDDAYDLAFGGIQPANKRTLIGVDVSGSMCSGEVAGMTGITPRVGAMAMAMAFARTEPDYHLMAFSSGFIPLDISARDSLRTVSDKTRRLPFDWTDCARPMLWALETNTMVDTFIVLTDNDTNHSSMHPHIALQRYRQRTGIDARMIVVGMRGNGFTIADPADPGMLDVIGFDTAAPGLMNAFSRREF